MEKWKSVGLYEHPVKHRQGTFGTIGQSQAGIYYLIVGGSRMSCPQDWAAKIHAEETGQAIPPEDREITTNIILRNISDDLHTALKVWAAKRRQTLTALVIEILQDWVNRQNAWKA